MTLIQSLRRRSASDWMRLSEALLLHAFVAAASRTMTYARLQRALDRIARVRRGTPASVPDITWAIGAVGRRIGRRTCLAEAAVAYTMLRRHGHDPQLRIGVRRGASTLDAHAWVECDGSVASESCPA